MSFFRRLFGRQESKVGLNSMNRVDYLVFLTTDSLDKARRIVEQHPELLSSAVDEQGAKYLKDIEVNPNIMQLLTERRSLLRRCREVGVARAFAEQMLMPEALAEAERLGLTPEAFLAQARSTRGSASANLAVPPEVQPLIAELSRLTQRTDMPRRIELCRQALAHVERGANPRLWAALQVELGNSHAQSLQGGRAENIEAAIDAYQQALQVSTRQAMPVEWAMTMMNLANAYADRIRGDKAENIEAAINAYQQALQVRTRQAMPVEWAMIMMNLANAYSIRIRGDKAENIEAAIDAYQQALQVMTSQVMPVEWAITMMNLANAYSNRIRGDKAENIEAAIAAYQQALQVRTRQAMPVEWAQTMMNLATAYYYRIRGDKAENIEAAIAAYQQALQVRTRQAMPVEWAQTQNNLANAYYSRIRGDKAENIEAAIAAYQQALQVRTRQAMPADYLRTVRTLGNVWFDQTRCPEAIEHHQAALAVAEELYAAAATPDSRQSLLQALGDAPQRLAYAQCRIDDTAGRQPAVVVLEQNRARWLREALEMRSARPDTVSEALWTAYQMQAQTVRELQAEVQLPDHTPGRRTFLQLSTLLGDARANLRATVDAIRSVAPDFLPKPSFDQIQEAAQDGPLVYLLATAAGGLALIVHGAAANDLPGSSAASGKVAGEVEAVWLDGLSEAEVNRMLYDQKGEVGGRYLRGAAGGDHAALTATLAWALPRLGDRLAQPLAETLAARYPHGTPVTLVASSNLGLLPLHAAPVTLDGRTAPLLDFFGVRYAPSATALRTAPPQSASVAPLLAIGNPQRSVHPALFTDWLAEEAARLAQSDAVLLHDAATVAAVESALAAAPPAHLLFGCHGSFSVAEPLRSGLALADGDLTLGRLLDQLRLDGVELATLCACQTAITDFRRAPDEVIGLPAALLQAGVRGVVGTLWSVEALPTVLLLRRYLTAMAGGEAALTALRTAVRWLRTLPQAEAKAQIQIVRASKHIDPRSAAYLDLLVATDARFNAPYPFADPADWAAFTFTGSQWRQTLPPSPRQR
ncbi:MAG: hypothetical protein BroJett021_22710 [Chloroflexota bacterium]|nr:MAG: hypothetical protein BroJett021_22710 [Chloroflexota bacterium]